jgi:hypothetical protein
MLGIPWMQENEIKVIFWNNDKERKRLEQALKSFCKDEMSLPLIRSSDYQFKIENIPTFLTELLRLLSEDDRKTLKEYVKKALENKWIKPLSSKIASLGHITGKKGRSRLASINFCQLNNLTVPDMYSLRLIELMLHVIRGKKVYSKKENKKGYYDMRIKKRLWVPYSIQTQWGMFQYQVMPFRMGNTPSCFQRVINSIIWDFLGERVHVVLMTYWS